MPRKEAFSLFRQTVRNGRCGAATPSDVKRLALQRPPELGPGELGTDNMLTITRRLVPAVIGAALYASLLTSAQAAVLTTNGIWTAAEPGNAIGLNGLGSDQLRWGLTFRGNPQSGYGFQGVTDSSITLPTAGGAPVLFEIGTFTHYNRPIYFDGIDSATLSVAFALDGPGGSLMAGSLDFVFSHLETLNYPGRGVSCEAGGVAPCPDLVEISSAAATQYFVAEGISYRYDVVGFLVDGVPTSQFLTGEHRNTSAILMGQITKQRPVATNLPAPNSLALFGLGLAGLAWTGVRQSQRRTRART